MTTSRFNIVTDIDSDAVPGIQVLTSLVPDGTHFETDVQMPSGDYIHIGWSSLVGDAMRLHQETVRKVTNCAINCAIRISHVKRENVRYIVQEMGGQVEDCYLPF